MLGTVSHALAYVKLYGKPMGGEGVCACCAMAESGSRANFGGGGGSSMKFATGGGDSVAGKTRRGACLGFSSQGKIARTLLRSGVGGTGGDPGEFSRGFPITFSY